MSHTIIDIVSIAAILLGPIVALELQKRLDTGREARNRKMGVFKTLMAYRGTPLAPSFVQALNLIDVEFNAASEKEKAVRTAWKVLLDHFTDLGEFNRAGTLVPPNVLERSTPLTTTLLLAMGKCLGFDFDEVQIKKGGYYPLFLGNVEQEQHALRRALLDVMEGKRRIPVAVFEDKFAPVILPEPTPEEPAARKLPRVTG
jgi:hypothetical protein